mmetsp:Transcript_5306/g.7183  ORF Transcript_5306/g.7183 Transcript_5306/m.7183 type:complete len:132 (-) Transcript_5306:204-599(-)
MSININVKVEPSNDTSLPYSSRLQWSKAPQFNGKVYSFDCNPTETVKSLKTKISNSTSVYPEKLMLSGQELEDKNTLKASGITASMSIWEHIWVDSSLRRDSFTKDMSTHKDFIQTKYHFMAEKFKGTCWA